METLLQHDRLNLGASDRPCRLSTPNLADLEQIRSEAWPRSRRCAVSASFTAEAIAGKPRSHRSKPKPQAIKKHPAGCFF